MDATTPALYVGGADDGFGLPIAALDQHIRPAGAYQRERGVLVEPGHEADRFESRNDGDAVGEPIDGAVVARAETPRRSVAVDRDQERRAESARIGEIGDVPPMKDVEHTVGEHQRPRARVDPRRKLLRWADLVFEWWFHWREVSYPMTLTERSAGGNLARHPVKDSKPCALCSASFSPHLLARRPRPPARPF